MNKIHIRKADVSDLETISQLGKELLAYDGNYDNTINLKWMDQDGEGRNFIREHFKDEDSVIFAATMDSKIIGYLAGGLVPAESFRTIHILAELEEIFVLDAYRGNDIGSKLISEFIAWSKLKSAERIRIQVSALNVRTINLYKRSGFLDYDLLLEKNLF
jgi:GNAT superfamily N-acetyltransferase